MENLANITKEIAKLSLEEKKRSMRFFVYHSNTLLPLFEALIKDERTPNNEDDYVIKLFDETLFSGEDGPEKRILSVLIDHTGLVLYAHKLAWTLFNEIQGEITPDKLEDALSKALKAYTIH